MGFRAYCPIELYKVPTREEPARGQRRLSPQALSTERSQLRRIYLGTRVQPEVTEQFDNAVAECRPAVGGQF